VKSQALALFGVVLVLALSCGLAQAGSLAAWETISQTDFAAFGTGGMRGNGTGSITVSGISGPVTHALLIWHGPADNDALNANATVSFNGNTITGSNVGRSDNNCWGFLLSHAYVADVTAYVSGNGTYTLTNFLKADADVNGVSLLVFYNDGNAANNRDVVVFAGNDSSESNLYDPDGWSASLAGINFAGGTAQLMLIVGDGQSFYDFGVAVNGTPYWPSASHNFEGDTFGICVDNNGCLWDHSQVDISSELVLGPNTLTLASIGDGSDCLGLVGAIFILPAGSAPPTPVELGAISAQRIEGGVLVSWETVMELDNLGFYLYRSTSLDGERTLVNTELIAGTGTSDGTSYSFLDAAAPDGPVFYWLEDVSTTFESELYGQVAIVGVQPDDETAGLTIGPEAGVYRVSYETLKAAGLPVDLMNPGDLKLNVDGEEAALFVSAWKGPMQAGDYVLFYAAAGEGERAVSVQSGVEAQRMEYAYAGPSEEGDVWVGQAGEGLLAFETQAGVSRYFVLGLPDNQALVLDVTAAQPKLLYGYAWVNQAQGDALYMSYETEQPAKLLAVAESAIRDVAAP